jgi:hypothetical protein
MLSHQITSPQNERTVFLSDVWESPKLSAARFYFTLHFEFINSQLLFCYRALLAKTAISQIPPFAITTDPKRKKERNQKQQLFLRTVSKRQI